MNYNKGDVGNFSHLSGVIFLSISVWTWTVHFGRPAALVHGKTLCSMTAVYPGADPGGGCRGCTSPPPETPRASLIKLVLVYWINIYLRNQKVTPFLSGAPRPKKYPGSPTDILRQRGPAAEDRESFVLSSDFANHADHCVRIERDRKKRANGYQFQQCSLSKVENKRFESNFRGLQNSWKSNLLPTENWL